jgi:hypothetical protein
MSFVCTFVIVTLINKDQRWECCLQVLKFLFNQPAPYPLEDRIVIKYQSFRTIK